MTETLLRNFEAVGGGQGQKVSWIEQVSIMVNELQTIMEIERLEEIRSGRNSAGFDQDDDELVPSDAANWGVIYLKNGKERDDQFSNGSTKSGMYSAMERFDPELFILVSQLTGRFYEEVEHLASSVSNFWRLVQSDTLEVENLHTEALNLANIIAQVYRVFKEIEDATEGGAGSGRSSDFRVIYTFALLQRSLLNDIVQYELYIQKMNSQREMVRLLHNNMLSQVKGPEDTGFVMAHGQNKNFGKVILCNQIFRKQLAFSSKELSHLNIVDFMPSLIKKWHSGFVSDFTKNGGASNGMLNRTSCLFLRKKNGYVIPAMVNVRFHYHPEHEFTFVCFTYFMKDIQIQKQTGTGKHRASDVLFFLCDDIDGRIHDMAEACSKQLGLSNEVLFNHDMENQVSNYTIEDICPTLSFKKIKQMRDESENFQTTNEVTSSLIQGTLEQIVDVDLNVIQNNALEQQVYQTSSQTKATKIQKALCQVFWEQYGMQRDRCMNIIALVLLDQIAMKQYLQSKKKARSDKKNERHSKRDEKNIEELKIDNASSLPSSSIGGGSRAEGDSHSGSGGSSRSSNTGTSETSMLKQMYQSTEKTASSSLKLITQLIFLVYILLVVVSTINLLLSLSRNDQLQVEVMTVRRSYDRLAIHGKTRLLLRGMINMANGFEPINESEITQDRFQMYMTELELQVTKLKDVQDFLDRVEFEYSSQFKAKLDAKIVPLMYLDINNMAFTQDQTYSYAMNLFIQRSSDLLNWNMTRFKGNLKIIQQILPPSHDYRPTDDERALYFMVKAGSSKMRSEGKLLSEQYRKETVDHALSVAQQTQLTIIISIVAIVLVSLIISPIICRIEERKYIGLKFFLNVEPTHLLLLDDQVKDFLSQAFSDASVHTSTTHQESNVVLNARKLRRQQRRNGEIAINFSGGSRSNNSEGSSSFDAAREAAEAELEECDSESIDSANKGDCTSKDKGRDSMPSQHMSLQQVLENELMKSPTSKNKKKKVKVDGGGLPRQQTVNKDGQDSQESIVHDQSHDLITSKQVRGIMKKPEEGHISMNASSISASVDDEEQKKIDEEEQLRQEEYLKARQQILEIKFIRLAQIARNQKIKTLLFIAILSILFSSYFIAGYFFSVNSFSQTPSILENLDTIFFKDVSLESAIAFIRENSVSNVSTPAIENADMPGSTFYLQIAEEREKDYLAIRRNIPSLFDSIKQYFDQVETEELCNLANKGSSTQQIDRLQICRTVYNGLLTKGLTYTMNVILNHFRNVNLRFEAERNRSLSFLQAQMRESASLKLIETKDFVLDQVFYELKDVVTKCTTDYYAQLIKQYTTLYAVFLILMTALFICFLVFGYNQIKDSMWKTNLTLKIMPLDYIPRHCLPELKAFFKY